MTREERMQCRCNHWMQDSPKCSGKCDGCTVPRRYAEGWRDARAHFLGKSCGDCTWLVRSEGKPYYCAIHDLYDFRKEDSNACVDFEQETKDYGEVAE